MLVLRHIHALPPEAHAFELETQALLVTGFVTQLDLPTRAYDPLPRQRAV
jgi:hypothetical protein